MPPKKRSAHVLAASSPEEKAPGAVSPSSLQATRALSAPVNITGEAASAVTTDTPAADTPLRKKAKMKAVLSKPSMEITQQLRDKALRIRAQLNHLFPDPPIPLDHQTPFQLLVAVILSAQTTDLKVNECTPALFQRAPDAAAMAQLSATEVESYIRVLGLAPTKARNVAQMSQMLVAHHGGVVPDTFEALESLPGVGHKTASVVLSQIYNKLAFPVDTHIHRLAQRWGLTNGSSVEQTEADLKALLPEDTWREMHLQIIFCGRSHCPAKSHDPTTCPICSWAAVAPYDRCGASPPRPGKKPESATATPRSTKQRALAARIAAAAVTGGDFDNDGTNLDAFLDSASPHQAAFNPVIASSDTHMHTDVHPTPAQQNAGKPGAAAATGGDGKTSRSKPSSSKRKSKSSILIRTASTEEVGQAAAGAEVKVLANRVLPAADAVTDAGTTVHMVAAIGSASKVSVVAAVVPVGDTQVQMQSTTVVRRSRSHLDLEKFRSAAAVTPSPLPAPVLRRSGRSLPLIS